MSSPANVRWLAAAIALGLAAPQAWSQEKPKSETKTEAKVETKTEKKKAVEKPKRKKAPALVIPFPPVLPNGAEVVTDTSPDFLKPPAEGLREGVEIAKEAPTVDFLYFPGQNYDGEPWSNWGDGTAAGGKYYSAIGDHKAPDGDAFVFEFDPATKKVRNLVSLKKLLNVPEGHYCPGKIHSRVDMGSDGKLYFSTHRGSPRVTNDTYHYKGDWIFRVDPKTAVAEIVVAAPVEKHCVPNSVLDADKLIFYGGTASGTGNTVRFFAYDCKNGKLLVDVPDGPARCMIFAKSTGRVYYTPGQSTGPLMRYDPKAGGPPVQIPGTIGIRAATAETPDGMVYTASSGQGKEAALYSFNTKTEEVKEIGQLAAGKMTYIASLDADPSGRYLYYIAGAHGGSDVDGSPLVQYDTKTNKKKVICFLSPYYKDKYGASLRGTYSTAVDPAGDKVYVTWNISRGSKAWDCCGLTCIHIPASERQP